MQVHIINTHISMWSQFTRIYAREDDEISEELFPKESSTLVCVGNTRSTNLEVVLSSAPIELFSQIKSQRRPRILVTSQY